jgi:bifunctional UDP-N-acetylglucosamine pyrophosphorylase/glucosamine-1-phosphate N-acetyltransferase
MTSDSKTKAYIVVSVILAAGRGSRMNGYSGNKTLLPLRPLQSPFEGRVPLIEHILGQLPEGPKVMVLHHRKEDVIAVTRQWNLAYREQPALNGTGGALLAAEPTLREYDGDAVLITMGDVPFVRRETYQRLLRSLYANDMAVLGFEPADKKQYGVIEIKDQRVRKIVEWKYWQRFTPDIQAAQTVCNAGIYAVRKEVLERYFAILANRPQIVHKVIDGCLTSLEEYFLTDLVEYMTMDGRPVGCVLCDDEHEPMGIDDVEALRAAQRIFASL